MKSCRVVLAMFGALCALAFTTANLHSQDKAAPGTVQVHMVITDEAVHEDSEAPSLQPGRRKGETRQDLPQSNAIDTGRRR